MSRYASTMLCLFGTLLSAAAPAHHSLVGFDRARVEEIEGEIVRLGWNNPHLTADVRVTGPGNSTQIWQIEGDAINTLMRRGLTREDLAVGRAVRFAGFPSNRNRSELMPTHVLLADKREIVMLDADLPRRWTTSGAVVTAIDLKGEPDEFFRVWSLHQRYQRKSPFVLAEQAERAVAQYDPADSPSLRCEAPGMPNANLNPYPIQFVRRGDDILLNIEEWEAARTIHLTAAAIPEDVPRSRLGYSIGRLRGNVLEIETGRLIDQLLDDDGTPMSADATIRETYTINPDADILEYEVTVSDPANLKAPATWVASWKAVPGAILRPFECVLEQ